MKLTPQQYADKLIEQYLNCDNVEFDTTHEDAARYSLIDVQNTIDANPMTYQKKKYDTLLNEASHEYVSNIEYYQEVKQILESKL